ncbi:MAG: translation elongation factor Ts [Deltaproteobacteria bacterium]|nr:translation elongation factor Ts [Deltaproteobacteria bacterium]
MTITAAKVMELRNATGVAMMDCKKALEETGGDMDSATEWLRKKGLSVAAKKSGRETKEGGIQVAFGPGGQSAAIVHLACETDFVSRNDQFQSLLTQMAKQVLAKGDQNISAQPLTEGTGTVADRITQAVATMGENVQLVAGKRVEAAAGGVVGGYVHSNGRIGVLVTLSAEGKAPAAALEALGRDLAMHIAASQVHALNESELDPAVLDKEKEIFTAQARESGKPEDIIQKMVQGRMNKFLKEVTLFSQPFVKNPDQTISQLLAEQSKTLGAKLNVTGFIKLQF